MRQIKNDEIEVLGSSCKKQRRRYTKWMVVLCILVLLSIVFWGIRQTDSISKVEVEDVPVQEEIRMVNDSSCVLLSMDSINDVPLTIYELRNLKAELSLRMPTFADSTVYFVLQAADVRQDNQQILGDFVLDGKQLARGKRKTGYCVIMNGRLSIGNSINDEMKDEAIKQNGDFFRQYPLVMDGEIQENRLKGKALRKALAQQGDDFYIVMTRNRESLYDFSEALADMGFTKALYLVGGTSYGWYRLEGEVHEVGKKEDNPLANASYLVFREMKSHE